MTTYDLGDGVPLDHEVYDRDGQLASATVAVTVARPDGTTVSPSVTSPSTGRYRAAVFPADQPGLWTGAWVMSGAIVDVRPFTFTVADPAPAMYATLPDVKTSLTKDSSDDRDDLIVQAIAAASRWIDDRTGRRFYADRTASARVFPVLGQTYDEGRELVLMVDDIASAEGLLVQSGGVGNWAAVTGWATGPDNALVYGRPINQLYAGRGWLPSSGRIQVTARWGWPAVPDAIAEATKMLARRFYKRKDSPQGVLGNTEWGPTRVSRTDPDVEALIAPFVIPVIA